MSENILYEATFNLITKNDAKYDRVSRFVGLSEGDNSTSISLDINTELYPLSENERITVCIALSLNLDGSKDDSKGWRNVGRGEQTLADEYDYVCHGKVYRFEEGEAENM